MANYTESLRFLRIPVRRRVELPPDFHKVYPGEVDSRLVMKPGATGAVRYTTNEVRIVGGRELKLTKRTHIVTKNGHTVREGKPTNLAGMPGECITIRTRMPGLVHLFKAK